MFAHVFSDNLLNTSFLSIGELCNLGCIATFTSTTITIINDNLTVLCGTKIPVNNLCTIPLPKYTDLIPFSAATIALSTDADFVRFMHAALGSPSLSSLTRAARSGYFHSYSRLTSTILSAHPPLSIATAQGHLDQHRKNQRSTKVPATLFDSDDSSDIAPTPDGSSATCPSPSNLAYTQIVIISDTLYSDLTGRFPVTSHTGA